MHDELKGTAIAAFVTLKERATTGDGRATGSRRSCSDHVAKKIGAIARPDDIFFTADLPKTRSGKIMRRLLRDIAEGRALGRHDDPRRRRRSSAALKTQYEDKEA